MTDHDLLVKILDRLDSLEEGQNAMRADIRDLQAGQKKLEAGQDAIRKEVKALSDKMDRRFDDIARNVAEAVDVVVDKIDGVRVATAKNGYRLDVLEGGRKA